jgi:lysophospholipase L1-like esterase
MLLLAVISTSAYSQGYHVRIGVIGNSITHGIALPDPATEAYPVQLGAMLEEIYGDTCIVENFGLTTTTMLKNGDVSYWDTQHLIDYLAYAPEICFILLGTNDTKPQNWDVYGDEFVDDYLAMIDTIKQRNPSTLFMLGYPPPAFAVEWGIRDSIIVNGIIPAIDTVLSHVDAELVDFYHPLLDSAHLFPDNIHPDVDGSRVMAEMILDTIIATDIIHKADTGLTFITSFLTETTPLAVGDSTELSWTSINADSVLLNDEKVTNEGSIKVSPPSTTVYTMMAMGQKSNDTVELVQEVYTPELSRLRVYPDKLIRYEGDTGFYQVYYYDQIENRMEDVYYSVEWNIIEGSGRLYEEADTSVYFITESPDSSWLVAVYEDLSDTSLMITWAVSGVQNIQYQNDLMVYPNPCNNLLNLQVNSAEGPLTIEIFDLKGALLMKEESAEKGKIHRINTSHLPEGAYIIKVESQDKIYTGKLSVLRN